jgi:hypothetical protein
MGLVSVSSLTLMLESISNANGGGFAPGETTSIRYGLVESSISGQLMKRMLPSGHVNDI